MPAAPPKAALTPARLASNLRITIARLGRRIRQESTNAGDDLTPSRIAALTTIESLGPVTLGEVAAVEQVQPPSMTRVIASLEERGLVARAIDTNDRRVARVEITDEGRRLLAQNRDRRTAFLARRIAQLSAAEQDTLARALVILERLQDDDA